MQPGTWNLPIASVILIGMIFVADVSSPLEYEAWIAYLLPLWLAYYSRLTGFPMIVALACTALMAATHIIFARRGVTLSSSIFNSAIGAVLFWCTAWILERNIKADRDKGALVHNLGAMEGRLRRLSHRLMGAQETERRRIARDLHDDIGQTLAMLSLNLREVRDMSIQESARRLASDGVELTRQVIAHIRNLTFDLKPPLLDELGIAAALQSYVDRQASRVGWVVKYEVQECGRRPDYECEIVCFRVVQEALSNIMRHAKATHVFLSLTCMGTEIEVSIRDNGIGFDVAEKTRQVRAGASLGLLSMEERVALIGGTFQIQSAPMEGTTVLVRIPFAPTKPLEPGFGMEG